MQTPQPDAEAKKQSEIDKATIKIMLIDNGILIKTGCGVLAFANWARASLWIGNRLEVMARKRAIFPKLND